MSPIIECDFITKLIIGNKINKMSRLRTLGITLGLQSIYQAIVYHNEGPRRGLQCFYLSENKHR